MIATASVLSNELFAGIDLPAGSRVPPLHLTWHVAAAYDWIGATEELEAIAAGTAPFGTTIDRAHVFATDCFAVVGLLAPSLPLERLHDAIVNAMTRYSHHVDLRYATSGWLPHVTLASGLSEEDALDLRDAFERRAVGTTLPIDNLAFLSVDFGRFILSNVRRFNGERSGRTVPDHE